MKQKNSASFLTLVFMGLFANPGFAEEGFAPLLMEKPSTVGGRPEQLMLFL